MDRPSPSFGTHIRAARLGWGYAPQHGAFIRMSDADGANSRIELCPLNAVPSKKVAGGFHRVWWESPGILDLIPWLKGVRRIKRYMCVVVDTHGTILKSEA